jgi:hypothetical protein
MTPALVHRPEDGKRAPLEVGAWAVFEEGNDLIPRLHLVRIVDGPTYRKDADEHAVDELWRCDDGQDRSRWCLTRVFVDETAADARALVPCVLAGAKLDRRETDALMLRIARIAELADRRVAESSNIPRDQRWTPELAELSIACDALGAALAARRRLVHVALPNLARNLYWASLFALAAEDPGVLYAGVPHRDADKICDLIARRPT